MTNREKYAKTPLDEVLEAYTMACGHGEPVGFNTWLGQPAEAGGPKAPDGQDEPKRQANPLPGALGALAGLLAAGLAGRNGEPPHVNVWVLVNGRPA